MVVPTTRSLAMPDAKTLLEKIEALPPDRVAEIEDFVDFIVQRDKARSLTRAGAVTSVPVFAINWNNPHDDAMLDSAASPGTMEP
jgi:hypothetical protein